MPRTVVLNLTIAELNRYPHVDPVAACRPYVGASWVQVFVAEMERNRARVIGVGQIFAFLRVLILMRPFTLLADKETRISRLCRWMPWVNIVYVNLESPIFELGLYKKIRSGALNAREKYIGFGSWLGDKGSCKYVIFPAFQDTKPAKPIRQRQFRYAMVCTNNYHAIEPVWPRLRFPWRFFNLAKRQLAVLRFADYRRALANSTSEFKVKLLIASKRRQFALYGGNWLKTDFIPRRYEHNLADSLKEIYYGRVDDKATAIGDAVFNLAIENTCMDGYITEKIFDCFAAGTIPVYLGAPDISLYVPGNAFVDVRRFRGHMELLEYLDNLGENDIKLMLDAGSAFFNEWVGTNSADRFAKTVALAVLETAERVDGTKEPL